MGTYLKLALVLLGLALVILLAVPSQPETRTNAVAAAPTATPFAVKTPRPTFTPTPDPASLAPVPLTVSAGLPEQMNEAPARALSLSLSSVAASGATPTPTPEPRRVISYTVQAGDSVWSIAARFSLDIDTLRWSNPALARNPDRLGQGQVLTILPVRGAYHTVQAGETLEQIASAYGVDPQIIAQEPLNGLSQPVQLQAGQHLVIPGGSKDVALPKPSLSPGYTFAWPLAGAISQGYHAGHHALDIAGPYDTPVYAAASGTVIYSGFSDVGYGYMVQINHGGGLTAIYGHLKGDYVAVGDTVQRGQMVGRLGSTGNSTGPHVHFEVRLNGAWANPLTYLPPR